MLKHLYSALIVQRDQMEAYAQDVINRYELGKKGLDIEEARYMGVLISERERCERLYHDNPEDWDKRKYLNRLK